MYKVPDGWYEGIQQFYREENEKVYKYYQGKERILYDFGMEVGDTILIEDDEGFEYKFFPIYTGDTTIYNRKLKLLDLRVIPPNSQTVSNEKHIWIEGVGDIGFFFGNGEIFGNINASPLTCVREDEIIYSTFIGCPDAPVATSIDEKAHALFTYSFIDKSLLLRNSNIKYVEVYSMQGQKVKTIEVRESLQRYSLADISLNMCVVRAIFKDSYQSELIIL